MVQENRVTNQRLANDNCGADFCRIFHEDMSSLYLLSLLVMANPAKAEECYVSALEDCVPLWRRPQVRK